AEYVAYPGRIVAAEVAVLVEDADFCVLVLPQDVPRVKPRSQPVARAHAAHRVGRLLVIAPPVSAALDEKLRNLSLVEISRNGELRGRSKRAERKGDVVDFDQLARLHPGPPQQIAVVGADQVDLAAVDAALI